MGKTQPWRYIFNVPGDIFTAITLTHSTEKFRGGEEMSYRDMTCKLLSRERKAI